MPIAYYRDKPQVLVLDIVFYLLLIINVHLFFAHEI